MQYDVRDPGNWNTGAAQAQHALRSTLGENAAIHWQPDLNSTRDRLSQACEMAEATRETLRVALARIQGAAPSRIEMDANDRYEPAPSDGLINDIAALLARLERANAGTSMLASSLAVV